MAGHLGLLVVYLVDEQLDVLFYKHLEQIERCSADQPFRIYAGVNRLGEKYREHLRLLDFVELCDLVPTTARESQEHAHYLDQLAAIAVAAGATRLATLDVDSFPISPAWISRSDQLLRDGRSLVGVLRKENGDIASPHPSFMFFTRDFYEQFKPSFAFDAKDARSQLFLKATRQPRLDTGAGYGIVLHERQLRWAKLLRSNAVNEHPLLAGIYGGLIFHFGGGSRDKVFSVDVAAARRTRPQATLEELWPGIAARNDRIARSIADRLGTDFDGYMRHLLGAAGKSAK